MEEVLPCPAGKEWPCPRGRAGPGNRKSLSQVSEESGSRQSLGPRWWRVCAEHRGGLLSRDTWTPGRENLTAGRGAGWELSFPFKD